MIDKTSASVIAVTLYNLVGVIWNVKDHKMHMNFDPIFLNIASELTYNYNISDTQIAYCSPEMK